MLTGCVLRYLCISSVLLFMNINYLLFNLICVFEHKSIQIIYKCLEC